MEMKLIYYPDPRLREPGALIEKYDDSIAERVKTLFKMMYELDGVGLAATQVGWPVQLFVVNFLQGKPEGERVYWNPKVGFAGDPVTDMEGCLSFASLSGEVPRFPEVCLEADTPQGRVKEFFQGYQARGIQHEVDHLKGILYIERMDSRERAQILKEFARKGFRV